MRQGLGRWVLLGGLVLSASACKARDAAAQEEPRMPMLAVFQETSAEDLPEGSGGGGSAGTSGGAFPGAPDAPDFYGTVTVAGSRGFTVRDDDGVERPFAVAPATRILQDGQRVPQAHLRPGVMVHTTYGERLGTWVATDVEIYSGTPSRDLTAAAVPVKRQGPQ